MADQLMPNTQNVEQAANMVEDTMQQVRTAAGNAGEEIWSTAQDLAQKAREQTQDLAQKAREQTNVATEMLYQQGTAAGDYLARNVNAYPLTALFLAAGIGYGIAYLMHRNSRTDAA